MKMIDISNIYPLNCCVSAGLTNEMGCIVFIGREGRAKNIFSHSLSDSPLEIWDK